MPTQIYGYVRVSSTEQNEGRQLLALGERSVPSRNIYVDNNPERIFFAPNTRKWSAACARETCCIF